MIESVVPTLVVTALLAWVLVAALSCLGCYRAQRERGRPYLPVDGPQTAIIIPVRGRPPHLEEMWRGLSSQTYLRFRIIFAVESASDPAYEALRSLTGGPPNQVVVAGPTGHRSQKIHNLLSALQTLQESDAAVVFADADIIPDENWLARIMKWLIESDHDRDIVSGYRWMIPTDNRWATAFVCVINSSVATAARVPPFALAWGGSMAVHRRAIAALQLEKHWSRASLDDLTLTRLAQRHGGRVHCPRDALVCSPVSYNWRTAIDFGRRQYLFIRIHAPWHWWLMAAITTVPLIGWAVALPWAVQGSVTAISAIVAANTLDVMRAHFRRQVPGRVGLPDVPKRAARLDRWGTPIWLLVNAIVLWSTLLGRRIDWADRSYLVDGRGDVRRIDLRPSQTNSPP